VQSVSCTISDHAGELMRIRTSAANPSIKCHEVSVATYPTQTHHTPNPNAPHAQPKRTTRPTQTHHTPVGLGLLEVFGVLGIDLVCDQRGQARVSGQGRVLGDYGSGFGSGIGD
jgi:hypothetical protein